MITPNAAELQRAGGDAKALIKKFGIKEILVTEGAHGMTYQNVARKKPIHRESISQDVIDVTGAGDTALAAFVCETVRGWKIENCMDYANMAAGLVCGMMGTHVAQDIPRPAGKLAA